MLPPTNGSHLRVAVGALQYSHHQHCSLRRISAVSQQHPEDGGAVTVVEVVKHEVAAVVAGAVPPAVQSTTDDALVSPCPPQCKYAAGRLE